MTVAKVARPQISEFAIHFVHRDRASLDVDQPMRIASKISDHAILGVNGDAIAISILKRRGDD